ncbi:PaaI family thioesterase [Fulvivirga sp. RKSG066]|uniref:PaaI family thioesterase n=1 Tax=Fulvivirga aurantia TaxID=2529383 RepID=UPI0012BBF6B6|nr:PaaI family thioesterase [Fulvivirga aurantia]MTI20181.1 PaaI family thioesterase [Fulvivirga aurantia]
MPQSDHYRKLEWMYLHGAPINKFYKPAIKVESGAATITIESNPKYFHAANAVHGSVYFKMLDDAAFFAVNSLVLDAFVLTTNFNINLLRPVVFGELKSVGKVVYNARKSFLAEANLYNNKNQLIATGNGTFVKSKIDLNEEVGYKEMDS